jgi:hypothetical protein
VRSREALFTCLLACPLLAAGQAEPTQAQVEAAAASVAAETAGSKEIRREWQFKPFFERQAPQAPKTQAPEPKQQEPADRPDVRRQGSLLAEGSRLLVWVLAGIAVILLLWSLRRWIRVGALTRAAKQATLPSHVRDLDIRPASLPEQVGDAVWATWQRGDHRAALSLLYRATLSRLVHVHAVPILGASTEGECVQLARARLQERTLAYVEQVVGAWQMSVYGARKPDDLHVQQLCHRFDAELPGGAVLQGELR